MGRSRWVWWGLASAVGCAAPSLDLPRSDRQAVSLVLEPAADIAEAPPTFRARVVGAAAGEPWLLSGSVSAYHDRALRQGTLSSTLRERAVPLRYWREGSDCLLQPLAWLEPGAEYTLAVTGLGRVESLRIAAQPAARAMRIFPPPGTPSHGAAMWCGERFDEALPVLLLEPGAVGVELTRDTATADGSQCLLLTTTPPLEHALMAPPTVGGTLLEPTAFLPTPARVRSAMASCAGMALAGACVEIEDDRVFVTPLEQAALWLLSEPRRASFSFRVGERMPLLKGLEPLSSYELRGQVIGADGSATELSASVQTSELRRHLVLNEVLANALGPEPQSEWLELVNDGHGPTSLAGVWLEDSGGAAALPDVVLAPGEYVLLVAPGYRPSGLDVPRLPGVRVIELPSLGTRGLANSGEALLLVGPDGVLARFPLLAAGHAGRSVARRALDSADDDAAGFAEHGAPGASPGAPNSFD